MASSNAPTPPTGPNVRLQPIVYVTDMARSIDWYANVLGAVPTATSDHWSTFDVDGTTLALHATETAGGAGSVELSLVAADTLDRFLARTGRADPIQEQPFGRSLVIEDPDGTRIQVNEHR